MTDRTLRARVARVAIRSAVLAAFTGFLAACFSVAIFLPGVIWHWGSWAITGMQGWIIFVACVTVIGLPLAARDPEYWKRARRHG